MTIDVFDWVRAFASGQIMWCAVGESFVGCGNATFAVMTKGTR